MAYDGSLKFDTKIDEKGFKKGVSKLKDAGTAALKTVAKATVVTTAAIAGMGLAATKVGMEFEAAMSRVGALSNATGQEFELLKKTAMDLGRTTVFSASEAAEGMQYLAMAGYKTNDIVSAMPGLLNAAAAGQTELGTAADITSNILSGFGLMAEETGRVADVLTLAFTSSNTSLESLGETMKYVAPVAKAAGFSLEEIAAAAGILGDAGLQGSQAGTALRAVILRLASAPKPVAEALDELGVSVVDSTGKMKPLHQIIGELDKATKGMTDAQKTAIISQIAGQNAASGLLAIMDAGADTLKEFTTELENAGGTAETVANKQIDNLKGDLALLGSVLETLGITVYEEFEAPLRSVTQAFSGHIESIVSAMTAQDDLKASLEATGLTIEDVGLTLEGVPAGLDGAVSVMGQVLADMLTSVAEFVPKMLKTSTDLMVAFLNGIRGNQSEIVAAALDIMQGFISAVLTILPEVIVLGIETLDEFLLGMVKRTPALIEQSIDIITTISDTILERLPTMVKSGSKILLTIISGIAEALPIMLDTGAQVLRELIHGITQMLPNLVPVAIETIGTIVEVLTENLPLIIDAGVQLLVSLIDGIVEALPDLITQAIDLVILIADKIIENIPLIIEAGIQIMIALMQGIIDNLPKLIQEVPRIINSFADAIYDNMPTILKAGVEIILMLIKGLIQSIPTLIANIPQIIMAIVNVFTLYNWWNLGKGIISKLGQGISGMAGNITNIAKSVANGVTNAIKGIFKAGGSIGKGFIGNIASGISGMISNVVGIARNLASSIVKSIAGAFKNAPSIGSNLVKGIWNGINNVTGWILNKIKGFGNAVMDGMKKIFGIKSPSTLMKDEIGENLTLGIGLGIEEGMPELQRDIDKEMAALTSKMKATVDMESTGIGTRISANSIGTASQTITVDTTNDSEKIDYDRLGEATVRAFVRSGIGISVNNREFGRLVADSLGERRG